MSKHKDEDCQVPFCRECLERIKVRAARADSYLSKSRPTPGQPEEGLDEILEELWSDHLDAIISLTRVGPRGTANVVFDGPALRKSHEMAKANILKACEGDK